MREHSLESIKAMCAGKKVLVVACEAGASQILVSMLERLNLSNVRFILEGPAIRIFEKKFGPLFIEPLTRGLVETFDLILTGTSLVPDLERRAIKFGQEAGIKVCSVVDHWVNYLQRFTPVNGNKNDVYFPDEIWVCDEPAIAVAVREGLPEEHLRKIENYYFMDIRGKSWPMEPGRILYVCEPVFDDVKILTGDGNAWGYNEFELVGDFLKGCEQMDSFMSKAVLRLHPNEESHKYDEMLQGYTGRIPVEISTFEFRSIEEECSRAEIVVGVESMALAIALYFGKKVFSCLPQNAKRTCKLPHTQIQHIRSVSEIMAVKNTR